MAGYKYEKKDKWFEHLDLPVKVCSYNTLLSRELYPKVDLIILDEAHLACGENFKNYLSHFPDSNFLSCSATPYDKRGLEHVASVVVRPITMQQLIEQGYLVDFKFFGQKKIDLSGIHIQNGDYNQKELDERMSQKGLCGDIIKAWREFGDNRPTVCFTSGVKHSQMVVDNFLQEGISACHMDASTSEDDRMETIAKFKRGEIKIISNCEILGTGVDIPSISCIAMARPTQSYSKYVQLLGRGTRTHQGKSDCIVIDHSGNIFKHGSPKFEREAIIFPVETKEKEEQAVCQVCFTVYSGMFCPTCYPKGKEPPSERIIDTFDGEIVQISDAQITIESLVRRRYEELKVVEKQKGYKKGAKFFTLYKRIYEMIQNLWALCHE